MVERLSLTRPGQTAKFLIYRAGRNVPFQLSVVLMDAELAGRIAGAPAGGAPRDAGPAWFGATVNDLTPSFRNQFGITVFQGAAVTSVVNGSPAQKAGVRAGDAIIEVSGRPISNARDLLSWLGSMRPGESVELLYYRGAFSRNAQVTLEVSPENPGGSSTARAPSTMDDFRAAGDSVPSVVPAPIEGVSAGGSVVGDRDELALSPSSETSAAQTIAELRGEVAQLKQELDVANQRLAETQRRLQQILDGLGVKP
jgi:membrane-associated protease RseP (regulator of RpoE activity)